MSSNIIGKLLQLDGWRLTAINILSNYGIYLPHNATLKKVFECFNFCAANKFWHYDNLNVLQNIKPINGIMLNTLSLFSFTQRGGSSYSPLRDYSKSGTVMEKLDTMYSWKVNAINSMKTNSALSSLNEATSLNTILGQAYNVFGEFKTSPQQRQVPSIIPNPENSKYMTSSIPVKTMINSVTRIKLSDNKKRNYVYENNEYYGNHDLVDIIYRKNFSSEKIYPIPEDGNDVKLRDGDKIDIYSVNMYYHTFFDDTNQKIWNPNVAYKPFTPISAQNGYFIGRTSITDHLPFNFKIRLVENTITRKINGLAGYVINRYGESPQPTGQDTMSLFIDFASDEKFLNPYELSHAIFPLSLKKTSDDYIKLKLLDITKSQFNEWYRHYEMYSTYSSGNRRYGNPKRPSNIGAYQHNDPFSVNYYGYDAWLFNKKYGNSVDGGNDDRRWEYYDIRVNFSSYLLGIFPVKDNDVIDYDNPILYRHIIPATAYTRVSDTSTRLMLKDIFNRSQDYNQSFEYTSDTVSENGTRSIVPYDGYRIPLSAFFHRSNKSPSKVYQIKDRPIHTPFDIGYFGKTSYSDPTIKIPKDMGKIAIKLYHGIPFLNVPKYLRDSQKGTSPKKFNLIEDTIYKGQAVDYKNRSHNERMTNDDVPYLYDVTEQILSTKALIIDPSKASYDNVPLMDDNLTLKIHKITNDAIYVITEDESQDYILDILLNCAKWWFTIPNIANNRFTYDGRNMNPKTHPSGITEVTIYDYKKVRSDDLYKSGSSLSSDTYTIKKALKLSVHFEDATYGFKFSEQSVSRYISDELLDIGGMLSNAYNERFDNMIYLNFSMSNVFFYNDTFLDYSKLNPNYTYRKLIKEKDGQFIFRTITPKDENKQNQSDNPHNRYESYNNTYAQALERGALDRIYDGASEIIYSIGLTPNTFDKLKFSERKYLMKESSSVPTLISNTIFNDFATGSAIKSNSQNFYVDIPEGSVFKDTYDLQKVVDTKQYSFPININEMTIDEIENIFLVPTNEAINSNGNNPVKLKYENFTQKYDNIGSRLIAGKNAKVYSTIGNDYSLTLLLLYYIVCIPRITNYSGEQTSRKMSKFNVCVETKEEKKKRITEFFKNTITQLNNYNPYGPGNIGNYSFRVGNVFGNDYSFWNEDLTIAIYSDMEQINQLISDTTLPTNTINRVMALFFVKYDMNWVFTYTPGLNEEKDKKIADILFNYANTLNQQEINLRNRYNRQNNYSGYMIPGYENVSINTIYDFIYYAYIKTEWSYSSDNDSILKYLTLNRNNIFNNYLKNFALYDKRNSINYNGTKFSLLNDNAQIDVLQEYVRDDNLINVANIVNSPLKRYADINNCMVVNNNIMTYREFKKVDQNKYVDNMLMGRATAYTEDMQNIPQDTRAVIVTLSLKDFTKEKINSMLSTLIKYNKKSIAIIFNIIMDDMTNTNHMPNDLKHMVTNYTDEYGSGVGFDFSNGRSLNELAGSAQLISYIIQNIRNNVIDGNNIIVDGIYFNVKNYLLSFVDIAQRIDSWFFNMTITDYRKRLMKKGIGIGYNLIILPDDLDKFKDVMDNNYDDLTAFLDEGTVKYYKIGNFDIPNEYKEKWDKLKAKIGYKIALHNMYKNTASGIKESISAFNDGRSNMYLDIVCLTRSGFIHTQAEKDIITKNGNYRIDLFSNINTHLIVSLEISSYMKYDNTHLIDVSYKGENPEATFYNTKLTGDRGSMNLSRIMYLYHTAQMPLNYISLINKLYDYKRIPLYIEDTCNQIINDIPIKTVKKEITEKSQYGGTRTTTVFENQSQSQEQNILNMNGFSNVYVVFKMKIHTLSTAEGPAWGEGYVNLANESFGYNNGIILNDVTSDGLFANFNIV